MAQSPELTAVLARIDSATNAVAAKLDALAAQISTSMTAEEVSTVVASLSTEADRLEAMGKTATNPVPEVPVVAPEPTP